jgi:hypothetical protein
MYSKENSGRKEKVTILPKNKEFIKTAKEQDKRVLFIKNNGDIGVVTYGSVHDYGSDQEYEFHYGENAPMPAYVFEEAGHTAPIYVDIEDVFEYSLEGLKQANERVKEVIDRKIQDLETRLKRVSESRTKILREKLIK